MVQLSDDCFAFGGSLLGIDAARQMIFERVQPVGGVERVELRQALGRTLSNDMTAPIAVPGFDNSAVDGYAMRLDDLDPQGPTTLRCVDRVAASHDPVRALSAGGAMRIFTGAALPAGADVVIMQEDCRRDGDFVTIPCGLKRGDQDWRLLDPFGIHRDDVRFWIVDHHLQNIANRQVGLVACHHQRGQADVIGGRHGHQMRAIGT